jgi:branched-chain amino acid aminotransferase
MNKGKICGQYVTSVLAKRMANKSGFDEALMLDPQGYVAEGTGENIFMVKNGVVRTPPLSAAILSGITRDTTITLLREQGVEVREEAIARDELYIADEVFLTGTAAEITPVRDIDHRKIGRGEAGAVTRRLQESFFSVVRGNDAKHDAWLTYI